MKIYNESKTQELLYSNLDFESGQLKRDKLFVKHHNAVPEIESMSVAEIITQLKSQGIEVEYSHFDNKYYKVICEYKSGGRDVEEIIPVNHKDAIAAYDEYEDIQVFVPYTEAELTERTERKELTSLETWFTEVYDVQVKQYDRCQRLGIEYDNKYGTIAELDKQAVTNAKRISELRSKYIA